MYAYAHRRERKGDFRKLWILRVGAASKGLGLSYSRFMHGLKRAGIDINRKLLADLAVRDPDTFTQLVEKAQQALAVASPSPHTASTL
jgi:large subunit ribosomal protein L20